MPNNKLDDIDRDMEWRLKQAQAVLDLFEKDCGRRAATMAEVRHWAGAQNRQHLQFRVKRRLLELLFLVNPTCSNALSPVFFRRHAAGAACVETHSGLLADLGE